MKRTKIHKLEAEEHAPFLLVGISYNDSIHKLAWALNSKLNLGLSEAEPIKREKEDGITCHFPVMSNETGTAEHTLALIKSKHEGFSLLKTLPNIDYVIQVAGTCTNGFITSLRRELKAIPGVMGTFTINPKEAKLKEPLSPI
ncbi:MAG: IPExxxVDY family protein [Bacteroidales bacterium]|nr:IPExxxVDY family protein [Bacteroidales bacterium]MBN2748655.1 IPExxxVDY family protein [Bacteroidales bacterium]